MSDVLKRAIENLKRSLSNQGIFFHRPNRLKFRYYPIDEIEADTPREWEHRLGIAMIRELQQQLARAERLLIDCKGRDYATKGKPRLCQVCRIIMTKNVSSICDYCTTGA